jgi:hypothetical protein
VKSLYGVLGAAVVIVACSDSAVAPIQGKPDQVLSNLGSMNVGDVRVLTFSAASGGLSIPADLQSAQYAVILGNVDVNRGSVGSYGVRGDWLAPTSQMPTTDLLAPYGRELEAPPIMSRGQEFEASLRNFERTRLPRPGG